MFAAANDGIYKYNPKVGATPGSFSRVHSVAFLANKRIWTTTGAIVVFSWASTGTNNMKDYKVHAFKRPSAVETSYVLAGTIEGQFHSTVADEAPEISVSKELKIVAVYGKSAAAAFFTKAKKFNYDAANSI